MHTAIPVHAFFTFAVFVVQITNIPVQYTGIPSFFDDVRGIFPIQPCVCRYVFPTRDMLILPLLGSKPCDVMARAGWGRILFRTRDLIRIRIQVLNSYPDLQLLAETFKALCHKMKCEFFSVFTTVNKEWNPPLIQCILPMFWAGLRSRSRPFCGWSRSLHLKLSDAGSGSDWRPSEGGSGSTQKSYNNL